MSEIYWLDIELVDVAPATARVLSARGKNKIIISLIHLLRHMLAYAWRGLATTTKLNETGRSKLLKTKKTGGGGGGGGGRRRRAGEKEDL